MGQGNSLNCKNNSKDQSKQIQTNQNNALLLMRAIADYKEKETQSPTRQSNNRTPSDHPTPLQTSNAQKKNTTQAQHQNILRVSNRPFRGAERVGGRWVQRGSKSLAEIVEGRYNTTMHFPKSQVVILIESLLYALAYLQKAGIRHHDFYPTNIYYSEGIFKLSSPSLQEVSAYTLTQQRRRFSFLSPELIAQIIEETPEADIPTRIMIKADLFAIGMIMLEFCTLEQSSDCYDQENYQLIDRVIQGRLAKVAQLYSPAIADCIAEMLKYDVQERIGPSELAIAVFLNAPPEKAEQRTEQSEQMRSSRGKAGTPIKPNSPPMQHLQVPRPGQGPPPPQHAPSQQENNNIEMPAPNYVYSRIGPNNQSLLSGSALQNKLRVIQKIPEKPDEEDSEGQPSQLSQPSQLNEGPQMQRIVMGRPHLQMKAPITRQQPPPQPQHPAQPMQREQMPNGYRQQPEQSMRGDQPQPMYRGEPPQQIIRGQPPQQYPREQFQQQPPMMEQRPLPPEVQMMRQPPQNLYVKQQQQGSNYVEGPPPPPPPTRFSSQTMYQQDQQPPKPNSPPFSEGRTFLFPSTGQSSASGSVPLEGKSNDKVLLSQPTYYETQAKKEEVEGKGSFQPKILEEGNFQFNFTEKYGKGRTQMPDYKPTRQTSNDFMASLNNEVPSTDSLQSKYPSQRPTEEMASYKPQPLSSNAVPTYYSSSSKDLPFSYQSPPKQTTYTNKYSTSSSQTKYNLATEVGQSRPKKQSTGETLEQRVDRILQISRSIK